MYGEPALAPDFIALPQVNPDAPKGGRIVFGETGGFDSLNPFILKGRAPWGVASFTVETLLGRAWDEPFTLYGLLAESVITDEARTHVEFILRESARFADGSPVTVEDVIWSFHMLGEKGAPRFHAATQKVAQVVQTGPRSVRFDFAVADRELPLILGLRPILKKAQWDGRDFAASGLEPPMGSGPYVVAAQEPGRFITFRRNPDWWGKDLPYNRGQHNFDEIRFDYFSDANAVFEAFKAGVITSFRETSAARWATAYDFDRVASGAVVKSEIPHGRPSGMSGLAFNTRRPVFTDWRVREALIQAFNFEFINTTLNGAVEPRIASVFSNAPLAGGPGPAAGAVRDLLLPFADSLPPGALEGYALPATDGTAANRAGIRRAIALMAEAGWTVQEGQMKDAAGTPFTFEILLPQGAAEMRAVVNIYAAALDRMGIAPRVALVDPAQYQARTAAYDFDMTPWTVAVSLSPGNEQRLYWGRFGVEAPGTRNLPGIDSPAVEAMIDRMLTATDPADFTAAVQALDRALTAGRYAIPLWFADRGRIAHDSRLRYPDHLPVYGDWQGFQPEVWWYAE
ncbi:extracellular solute-binding protein [Xinfangfangia sp. LG-4]|uniref:Extracellular solute-binding protein n=2 Tax=Ruixingdingia sedimenti TaxID=3073604 RepID=A0ABU1F7T0_9RHOB|nr:extracellular solute-binding protein [Xinfangfangia sp. LG-4]MDR5652931.1 extracellular solute-binding protein [Xinfangfangia sp. LG-4]